MSALSKPWSAIKTVLKRWQDSRSVLDLKCCAEDDVERMARDLGVSVPELHRLASLGPQSDDPLSRRMAALDLDIKELRAAFGSRFRRAVQYTSPKHTRT